MSSDFYDVIVVGAGTAGICAAIASARQGARTLLVEESNQVGGTSGYGMAIGGLKDNHYRQVVHGIPAEITKRVVATGGGFGHLEVSSDDRWISSIFSMDPEVYRLVVLEMLEESGCDLLLHGKMYAATVVEGRVVGIETAGNGGIWAFGAKVFVDATGDGDVAHLSGVECRIGDERGRTQSATCVFRMGNVNIDAFEKHMNETINSDGRDSWRIKDACARVDGRYWLPWRDADRPDLPNACGIYHHGNKGDVFINTTHFEGLDLRDPFSLSRAEVALRRQAAKVTKYLREEVPGFEEAYLAQVYPIGIRDSRRIVGEYTLTEQDLLMQRRFHDVIAFAAYPPDVHLGFGNVDIHAQGNRTYEIPYRSLLPQSIDGLLVAGRCISTEFRAQAGVRGMGPCMATGQAAGVAEAKASKENTPPRELDIEALQSSLAECGALRISESRESPQMKTRIS